MKWIKGDQVAVCNVQYVLSVESKEVCSRKIGHYFGLPIYFKNRVECIAELYTLISLETLLFASS